MSARTLVLAMWLVFKVMVSCILNGCAVSGFGFGVISGAFSLVNVLADMTGPGTVGIMGQSSHFFITSGSIGRMCLFWGVSLLLYPGRGVAYCDQSVHLSVCTDISGTT